MAATLRKIAGNPSSFSIRYKQFRLAHIETFPYAAHFYIDDNNDTVYVIAILHISRRTDTPNDRL